MLQIKIKWKKNQEKRKESVNGILISTEIAGLTFQFTYSNILAGVWGKGSNCVCPLYTQAVFATHLTHQLQFCNQTFYFVLHRKGPIFHFHSTLCVWSNVEVMIHFVWLYTYTWEILAFCEVHQFQHSWEHLDYYCSLV